MVAVNYSTVRENLKKYCDKVSNEGETVIVTRKCEKNVVILSMDDYNALLKACQVNKSDVIELTDEEKIDIVAKRILKKYHKAFEELAK